MRTIAFDCETFYDTKEGIDIKSLGASGYVRDPRVDCYLISVSDGAETWAGHPRDFNFESLRGATLLAHNFGFDSAVLREMMKRGIAPTFEFSGHCTANLSVFCCGRRSLAEAAEYLLGTVVDKSYRLDANGKTWDEMIAAGVSEKVKEAGRVDALRCHQLWTKFSGLWPEFEKNLSALTIAQGQRGIQIDTALLAHQLVLAQRALIDAETKLPWIEAGRPPTSIKAIAEACRAVGIPCPPVKSRDGQEAFDLWESQYGPKYSWVQAVADWRQINKMVGQLETIKGRLDESGVLPFDLLYGGAHTLRWSGAGGLNLQNLRKAPLVVGEESLDVRALFIARPGCRLIVSDLAQIEARVALWFAKDWAMLNLIAKGVSIYEAYARQNLGWTGGTLKKENKELYALSKAVVLGLGFGAGAEKFLTIAKTLADVDLTVNDPEFVQKTERDGTPVVDADRKPVMISGRGTEARRLVKQYRESNPGVTACWKRLDEGFRASCGSSFEIGLPSGRSLRYGAVRREPRNVLNEETGKMERRWTHTADIGGRRFPLWGGVFFENLVQSTARDVLGEAMLKLEATPGIRVLFSVHDEVILECAPEITPELVTEVMSHTPEWLRGCPIGAETAVVPCYTK